MFNRYILILFCVFVFGVKAQSQCLATALSSTTLHFDTEGGSSVINVTTQKSCTTYTITAPSWIGYSKNGLKVTITLLPNPGIQRSGTVNIGGRDLTVIQYADILVGPAQAITGTTPTCQGKSYSYNVQAIEGAVSYSWSYSGTGVNINGSGNTVTLSFSANATPGNLFVAGVSSQGTLGTQSPAYPITVNPTPAKPVITANGPTTICSSEELILTSSPGQSYEWSNDGTAQSIQVLSSGNYTVKVTNAYGCVSPVSDPVAVTINPSPLRPNIQVQGSTTFCEGNSVTLTAPTESYYVWSNGATSKDIAVTTSGSFSVQVMNSYGCISIPSLAVSTIVNPLPSVSITSLDPPCDDNPFTLAGPSGMPYYNWSGPNNASGSSDKITINASHFDESTGTYYLTVRDGNGCGNTASKYIEVNILPPVFTISNNSPVCRGDVLNFTGPSGMSLYSWSGPGSFSSSAQNPSISDVTTSMAGRYYLKAFDGNGCSRTVDIDAVIDIPPIVSASNSSPVCEGNTVTLTAPSGLPNYTWSGPDGAFNHLQNATLTYIRNDQAGTYTLTSTNGACTRSASTEVVVNPSTPVVLQGNRIILEGAPLALTGPDGMVSYSWTGPGITGTNTSQNPVISNSASADMSGTYTLTIINKYNCSSVASEQVVVKPFDKAPVVGSIAGGFNVSSSGAATYQIPIFTSPGTNGMKPDLSIGYNSQAGNGYLGMGWNLTGFSSISRLPLNLEDDGQVRAVQLNASDKFGLDGNRLVVTNGGVYGAYNTEYRTQNETFVKVTSYGTAGSGPRWFKVETKDGTTIEYGNSATSYLQPPDKDEVMFWYISKVTDKFGNYMTYTYHVDRTKGEFWPEKIDYTFNDQKLLTSYNSVNFSYQARPDNTTIYLAGYPLQHNVLLNQVQMISEGVVIREYDFIYSQNSCPQLNEVAEYGTAHTKINSTFVNWIVSPEKSTWVVTPFTYTYRPPDFLIDDFNGDGKKEVLPSNSDNIYALNQNNTGFINLGPSGLPFHGTSGDFDGDGRSDVVCPLIIDSIHPTLDHSFSLYKFMNNSFSLVGNYGIPLTTGKGKKFNPGDFNGDGITDLIVLNYEGNILNVYWGDPVSPFSSSTSMSNVTWGTRQYIKDINGDGKPEIVTVDASGYYIYEWQVSSFQLVQTGAQPNNTKNVYFGDLNGDGKQDFVYNTGATKPTFTIAISTGVNFLTYTQTLTGTFNNVSVLDINGDGHDEFSGDIAAYAWQGNQLVSAGYGPWYSVLEDFDGDGNADGLFNDGPPGSFYEMFPNVNNTIYKKVASIINGMGNTINIAYKPLTSNTVHTLSTDGAYRSIDFAPSTLVVSSVQTSDGKGGFNQIDYHYNGAKFDNREKSFLGFASVSQTDNTAGLVSTSYSTIDPTYHISKPVKTEVATTSGTPLSEKSFTTTIKDFGGNRIFMYMSGQSAIDHLHNDATVTSSVEYDDDGNLTRSTTNASGISTSVTTNTYTTVGTNAWCPNKPDSSTTTLTRTGESDYTTSSSFDYNANGSLSQVIREPGNEKQQYTNYQYNDFGNVIQVKVSPDGVNGRVTNYVYDNISKGRMPTRQSNVLGHFIDYTNDYALGVVTQATDHNNVKTTNQYDNFGALQSTVNPDGTTASVTTNWVTDTNAPQGALYYTTASATGKPNATTYFDALGRPMQSETTGFDGSKLITQTGYTTKGQVDYVTLPYYEGGSNADRKSYGYDSLGRVISETAPGVSLSYTYDGLSTTVTNNITGQSTTKTADASGALQQSTDAGGTISYVYNAMGQVRKVTSPSGINEMTYDQFGRQLSLSDPNAGSTSYDYNVYGELTSQTDVLNNTTSLSYDDIGRVYHRTETSLTSDWVYNANGRLDSESASTGLSYAYTYNTDGSVKSLKETESNVFKTDFTTSYDYENGRVSKVTYPSGFALGYVYQNGYLAEIKRVDNGNNTSVWKLNSLNAHGQITGSTCGNGMVTTRGYNNLGYLNNIVTSKGINKVQDLEYGFTTKGYMDYRKDNRHGGINESFGYDDLGRLTSVNTNGTAKTITYETNGNISAKSDAGTYAYDASHPNAVGTITDNKGNISSLKQDITYTSFSMPSSISENGNTASFTYGPEHERKIMTSTANGGITKYYSGTYERQLVSGVTRELHYVVAYGQIVAIFEQKSSGESNMYYVHTDHLGSLNVLTDAGGNIAQETSYDAWGNRRDPATLQNYTAQPTNLVTDRGFTGHEHLDGFKLINMNGRVYDPALGRFLSADPYVQAPDFTQSYNRYSYCMNNPLSFTDPSGYLMNPASLWVFRQLRVFSNDYYMQTFGANTIDDYALEYGLSHGGGGSASGILGYTYSDGKYMDVATGKVVEPTVATNWLINDAAKNGGISLRYYPGAAYNARKGEYGFWVRDPSYKTADNAVNIQLNWVPVVISDGGGNNQGGSGEPNYWLAKAGAIAVTTSAADGPIPIGEAIGATIITAAVVHDGVVAISRYLDKPGVQYTLRAKTSGYYSIYSFGSPLPTGTQYLDAGDIWKIGQTTDINPATGTQYRYTQSQLNSWGVQFVPEFYGDRAQILVVEKMKIWNYIHIYNALPPGNKVPW